MIQNYITKVQLNKPMSMGEIAALLGLQDVKSYTTDLPAPKIVGRVGGRLWIIHLYWGTWEAADKIKVYAVPGMDEEEASITEYHIDRLLND